jgi:hypothetical protein
LIEASKTLEHLHAYKTQAAERYILGELTAAEAEEFESHYFECEECATAVESGQLFVANARALPGEPDAQAERLFPARNQDKRRSSFYKIPVAWMRPGFILPALAAVVLAAVALYQAMVIIPAMRGTVDGARALPAFQLVAASRGESQRVQVPLGSPFFSLSLDVPPDSHFAQYICDFSTSGRNVFRLIAPAPGNGLPISILVPVKALKPGNYELVIFGAGPNGQQADKIAASTFDLQFSR